MQVVSTILASTTRLIANKAAWEDPAKRSKIEDVALLLRGAIEGRNKVGLKMNVHRRNLQEVRWAPCQPAACLPIGAAQRSLGGSVRLLKSAGCRSWWCTLCFVACSCALCLSALWQAVPGTKGPLHHGECQPLSIGGRTAVLALSDI